MIKEAQECLANPKDPKEYADCLLLVLDAARRAGFDSYVLLNETWEKLAINKARKWPTPTSPDTPVEHLQPDENKPGEPLDHFVTIWRGGAYVVQHVETRLYLRTPAFLDKLPWTQFLDHATRFSTEEQAANEAIRVNSLPESSTRFNATQLKIDQYVTCFHAFFKQWFFGKVIKDYNFEERYDVAIFDASGKRCGTEIARQRSDIHIVSNDAVRHFETVPTQK